MADYVFILGAGASHQAGAPLMGEFLNKAEDLLTARAFEEDESDVRDAFRVIQELSSVYAKSNLDLNNIEDIFGTLEMAKLLRRLGEHDELDIDRLYDCMIKLIVKTLEKAVHFPIGENRGKLAIHAPGEYAEFVMMLSELEKCGISVAVITFNYDLALDFAAGISQTKIDYGLSSGSSGLKIYKLHGSLNWAQSPTQGIVPITFDQMPSWNGQLGQVPWVTTEVSHYLGLAGRRDDGPDEEIGALPLIVPPSWAKMMYHGPLSAVWSRAAAELSTAKHIRVIGYSLPPSDAFFRYLYALGTVGTTRLRSFTVVNPSDDSKRRYDQMIGPSIRNGYHFVEQDFGYLLNHKTEFIEDWSRVGVRGERRQG